MKEAEIFSQIELMQQMGKKTAEVADKAFQVAQSACIGDVTNRSHSARMELLERAAVLYMQAHTMCLDSLELAMEFLDVVRDPPKEDDDIS